MIKQYVVPLISNSYLVVVCPVGLKLFLILSQEHCRMLFFVCGDKIVLVYATICLMYEENALPHNRPTSGALGIILLI